jgi:hypothetical protein
MEPLHKQPARLEQYNKLVLEELAALEPIHIASVVSSSYVFDFLILYESLLESWTFYPFCLHAFASDQETYERLTALGLVQVEVHLIDDGRRDQPCHRNVLARVSLIERSGLDRCIVSDVDNVFLAETPELFMLLHRFDLVFVGSPVGRQIIQTSLWAFRRNERTIAFSHRWYEHSKPRGLADADGLPFALLENREGLEIKVLARPKASANDRFPSPYDVQANIWPFVLKADWLGFREAQMGRAKVLHLGALRPNHNPTVKERIETLLERFPETVAAQPFYVQLANRAAARLGMETLPEPLTYLRECSYRAGVLGTREDLPAFLNHRGLLGRGAAVGVAGRRFSELLLDQWRGSLLISIDPWVDAETKRRLSIFGDRSTIWRMTSEEAAARIDPASLDFVYLDGRHDDESVSRDLELWHEKVRPGGLLAGGQYIGATLRQGPSGVKPAVDEFFAAKGLTVRATLVDAPHSSWFVQLT